MSHASGAAGGTAGEEPPPARVADGLRFALGTLTVLPVPLTRWDRPAARLGMLCAPFAGLAVGAAAAAGGVLLLVLGAPPLLAAVVAVAVPAVLTRGLHLDGLADVADGLGSGKPAGDALRIMKQSDIGPFGVLALLLVVLGQVAAVAGVFASAGAVRGAAAVLLAAVTARAALTLAARTGVPAARPEGLGAAVAGAVSRPAAYAVAACPVVLACGAVLLTGGATAVLAPLAVVAGLACAEGLLHHCRRRFGGLTGDVFGAVAETAATGVLVVLSLG